MAMADLLLRVRLQLPHNCSSCSPFAITPVQLMHSMPLVVAAGGVCCDIRRGGGDGGRKLAMGIMASSYLPRAFARWPIPAHSSGSGGSAAFAHLEKNSTRDMFVLNAADMGVTGAVVDVGEEVEDRVVASDEFRATALISSREQVLKVATLPHVLCFCCKFGARICRMMGSSTGKFCRMFVTFEAIWVRETPAMLILRVYEMLPGRLFKEGNVVLPSWE